MTDGIDYHGILDALDTTLQQKQEAFTAATTRTAALGTEYDKAKATEAALAEDIAKAKANMRAIEQLVQQSQTPATPATTTEGE